MNSNEQSADRLTHPLAQARQLLLAGGEFLFAFGELVFQFGDPLSEWLHDQLVLPPTGLAPS